MIRVIHKAFNILEFLAEEPQRRKRLRDIAEKFKMDSGTCANIMKTMVQRKFVDQTERRGGYMLGPMVYYLARMSAYRGDLILAAEPIVSSLVKKINETALIVILRGNERFVIFQIDGKQSIQVGRDMFQKEVVCKTATGRLLMAHLNDHELNSFVAENGLPGDSWPQANSLKKLKTELEKIRRQEWIAHQPGKDLVGVACPIRENGQARAKNGGGDSVVAALGIFLPAFRFKGAHKKAIIKEMTAAAAGISARLASQSSAIQA